MISISAVLVAALAACVIGFVFRMPPLRNIWTRLAHITSTDQEKPSDIWRQILAMDTILAAW